VGSQKEKWWEGGGRYDSDIEKPFFNGGSRSLEIDLLKGVKTCMLFLSHHSFKENLPNMEIPSFVTEVKFY
jgi:hypothetical protein